MDPTVRKSLLRKIAALLRLGDRARNSSEGEALNAIEKAMALMRQYNVSAAEVQSASPARETPWTFGREQAGQQHGPCPIWLKDLGATVGRLCQCDFSITGWRFGRETLFHFLGDEGDVQVAVLLFGYLRGVVEKGMSGARAASVERELKRARLKNPSIPEDVLRVMIEISVKQQSLATIKNSYALGFVSALDERARQAAALRNAAKPSEGHALAIYSDNKRAWLDEARKRERPDLKMRSTGRRARRVDGPAFELGKVDGKRVDIATEKRIPVAAADE